MLEDRTGQTSSAEISDTIPISLQYQQDSEMSSPAVGHENQSDGWVDVQSPNGLHVLIVGGGLGGLAAAITLRRQGHRVEIYESSGFSKEVGAALHTAPNVNGVLKKMGISCKDIGANPLQQLSIWLSTGVPVNQSDMTVPLSIYEHKWRMAHRVKLHDTLRKVATSEEGVGQPAKLHLSQPVSDVDPNKAVVYFKDGTFKQGDVIIGADGVHSIARTRLPEGGGGPFPSGQSAFRFLVQRDAVLADGRTKKFAEQDGDFICIFGTERSIVIYPTSDNTILNFVCIHPDTINHSAEGWGSSAKVSEMLEIYEGFHPDILAILEKADEGSLKVWKLLDMKSLPSWVNERLAVMGDAAHPFLPFLGQGAAIAIEDAVTLGVVLESGLSKEDVPDRLKLYQDIRKDRAELIQEYTRQSGAARTKNGRFDMAQYQGYCFGHDEWDYSTQKLREWKWSRSAIANMSTVFGPSPAYQLSANNSLSLGISLTAITASMTFRTSRTLLDGFLPLGQASFHFKSRSNFTNCTIRQTQIRGLPSLGAQIFNHLSFCIEGIQYTSAEGQVVAGTFIPIVFENTSETIVKGALLGLPKMWSTVETEIDNTSYHVRTGLGGLTWGNFDFDDLQAVATDPTDTVTKNGSSTQQFIFHQYLPRLASSRNHEKQAETRTTTVPFDNKNDMALEQYLLGETESSEMSLLTKARVRRAGSAKFKVNSRDQGSFPSLHHILLRIQELPIHEIVEATVIERSIQS